MIDVAGPLRVGYYNALNGHISVPVYGGQGSQTDSAFVIIAGITDTPANTLNGFRTDAVIDIDICHRQQNGFTYDRVDSIANEVLQLLIPDVDIAGFTVASFQVVNVQRIGARYIEEPGQDENMIRRILRIKQTLIQQS